METGAAAASASAIRLPEGFNDLESCHQEIIAFYNDTMAPLGWRKVTRISTKLVEALAMRETDEWRRLWSGLAAEQHQESWPPAHARTFVRGHWHNY